MKAVTLHLGKNSFACHWPMRVHVHPTNHRLQRSLLAAFAICHLSGHRHGPRHYLWVARNPAARRSFAIFFSPIFNLRAFLSLMTYIIDNTPGRLDLDEINADDSRLPVTILSGFLGESSGTPGYCSLTVPDSPNSTSR